MTPAGRTAVLVMLASIIVFDTTALPVARDGGGVVATAKTAQGVVRGVVRDGAVQFLGIPYARPPVGNFRWRGPQAPGAYADAVYDASYPRSECVQLVGSSRGGNQPRVRGTEDC